MSKNILVTSALPYANGSIHLGHLVETIQTDIWVRVQKLLGNNCIYICADDTHGTAIMLSAKKTNQTPEELISKMHQEHLQNFHDFYIEFDNYYTTHSSENQKLAEYVYQSAKEKNLIYEKEIEQYFCPNCQIFLPDRLIKGTCPKCKAEDQYGDNCEICSGTYNPQDLINPYCVECHSKPILKKSQHFFFKLSSSVDDVKSWLKENPIREEIKNKMEEWFKEGLKDWDISRDAPYFGFQIPGTENKFFYVWLDAPIGYMASTLNWCKGDQKKFDTIWSENGDYEIYHFIGKDILYFHTLFWPIMLKTSNFKLPKKVFIHGFLTVNSQKMSKSRGTFILAKDYLNKFNPELLRYYYASKLNNSISDLDFSTEDFVNKINAELINKFINIASRLGNLITKNFNNELSEFEEEGKKIFSEFTAKIPQITDLYLDLEYHKAIKEIMSLIEVANKFINDSAPWQVVKENLALAQQICTSGINFLRLFTGLLKPVIPVTAQKIEQFLNIPEINFINLTETIQHHKINSYEHLLERIDLKEVNTLLD